MEEVKGEENKVPFPYEVCQNILQYLGPRDLWVCSSICRAWREEVRDRTRVLKTYSVKSMEELRTGLDLLKNREPGRSPFIIQDLYIYLNNKEDTFEAALLKKFIHASSSISLGRVWIGDERNQLMKQDVVVLLERNPNLYHLEFGEASTNLPHLNYSYLFQILRDPERLRVVPALRTFILPNAGCSLTILLRACPNLRKVTLGRLEAPFIVENVDGSNLRKLKLNFLDISTFQQLRDLNLSLTRFTGNFVVDRRGITHVYNNEIRSRLVQSCRQFLETTASSLKALSLVYYGDVVLENNSNLLGCSLPNLTKLNISLILVSDFNQLLASVPVLNELNLYPQGCERQKSISTILPSRIINDHPGIINLNMGFQTQPYELTLVAGAFQNLRILELWEVPHGHLSVVYSELAQLEVLYIIERRNLDQSDDYLALHDTDFVGTGRKSPYIGNMKSLQELELTFRFKSGDGDYSSLITDSILINGIFKIVTHLRTMLIKGAKFSPEVLKQMDSFMTRVPVLNDPEKSHYMYRNKKKSKHRGL